MRRPDALQAMAAGCSAPQLVPSSGCIFAKGQWLLAGGNAASCKHRMKYSPKATGLGHPAAQHFANYLVEAFAKVEGARLFDRQAEEDVANFFNFPAGLVTTSGHWQPATGSVTPCKFCMN